MLMSAYSAGLVFSWTPSLGKAKRASAMLQYLLAEKSSIDPSSPAGEDPGTPTGQIDFSSISYAYASRPDHPALKELTFTIAPGSNVAFVGPTGSGKSTLISMIERFYDPTSGKVLLDSRPLPCLNVAKYRHNIGLVNQEPTLFNGSIKENLIIGLEDEGKQPSDEAVEEACRQANIYDFIKSLP
jgi:ATP-binding cassette subfamily B (MDR/TAP) protein 1